MAIYSNGTSIANAATLNATVLTGALPAVSGANLTSLTSGNLTGALPAISGASLTGISSELIGFGARRDGVISVASDTYTKIVYNQEEWDSSSCFDTSTGTFTVPSGEGGKWFLGVTNVWSATVNRPYTVVWYENSVQRVSYHTVGYGASWDPPSSSTSDSLVTNLSASDTIEVYCSHYDAGGSAANLSGNDSYGFATHFYGFKVAS